MSMNPNIHSSISSNGRRPLWIGITSRCGDPEWLQQNARNYIAMDDGSGGGKARTHPTH